MFRGGDGAASQGNFHEALNYAAPSQVTGYLCYP